LKGASGVLKPVIVIELLVVMMLAGVGTAFAVEPHGTLPTPTPTPTSSPTPVTGKFLEPITSPELVPNPYLTQYIGVTVTVENKDATAAHSGIVYVAIDWEGETITGQGPVTNLAAGATTQVTVNLEEPISMGDPNAYYKKMRIIVTQTS